MGRSGEGFESNAELRAMPLNFTLLRTLRRGKHRLLLWPGQEADGSIETRTPSKVGIKDEMGRLEKVSRVVSPVKLVLIEVLGVEAGEEI